MIERDIYLYSYKIFDPIRVVEGADNQVIKFYVIDEPSEWSGNVTAKAFCKNALGDLAVLDGVTNNAEKSITIQPPSGYFWYGQNTLQLKIYTPSHLGSGSFTFYSFAMPVVCEKNLFNNTLHEEETLNPTEEMQTNYTYIRNQVDVNKSDIADIKDAIEHVNSGIECTEAEYEEIRESSEYDPEATYFVSDTPGTENEVYCTQAEYEAIRNSSDYDPNCKYFITDDDGQVDAEAVKYGDGSVGSALDEHANTLGLLNKEITVGTATDLNGLISYGTYQVYSSDVTNAPTASTGYWLVHVYPIARNRLYTIQYAILNTQAHTIYTRIQSGGNWTVWYKHVGVVV